MMHRITLAAVLLAVSAHAAPAADTPFRQETAKHYPFSPEAAVQRPLSVAASGGEVLVGHELGAAVLDLNSGAWRVACNDWPVVSVAEKDGAFYFQGTGAIRRYEGGDVHHVCESAFIARALFRAGDSVVAAGERAYAVLQGREHKTFSMQGVHPQILAATLHRGHLWLGTPVGLYQVKDGAVVHLFQTPEEIISANVMDMVEDADGRLWVAGLGGVTIFKDGKPVARHTPAEGIPRDTAGGIWVGTQVGAARWDGHYWSVRHGRRWLLDDNVIDIAPDLAGGVWVLTAAGVSHIAAQQMTLAEKARYFDEVTEARHVREPGLVEKIHLPKAGSLEGWKPEDDDNDGEYTSQYLAAQAFRYAVTKDPAAKAQARRSWKAITFLQEVTRTDGFIARTVIPHDWEPMHDLNRTYTPMQRLMEQYDDTRYKPVEVRWRLSEDGKWQWKGDTSSDEITGHYYAFGLYYDLVADEDEKPAVRAHVAKVTDYLIGGGYNLIDTDGTHTRWGVWAPEQLNDDPQWQFERGINSAELLGYLLTAWHVTGDAKYREHYMKLVTEHHYAENARHAKTLNPAWITYIDDSLLACVYRPLLAYETDPELLEIYRESFRFWYENIRKDQNAWFNYTAALLTGEEPEREGSLFFLRDTPLDLIEYTADQTRREDITLVRKPILETIQTSRLLPPSERATVRWDKNPYKALDGEGGHSERAPTFWLLAYWLGRHAGCIAE
jgi:hypothetical protein